MSKGLRTGRGDLCLVGRIILDAPAEKSKAGRLSRRTRDGPPYQLKNPDGVAIGVFVQRGLRQFLDVVVHEKLIRMGTETQGVVILNPHFYDGIHHVLGEDVSLEQELVILLECLSRAEK